MYSRMVLLFVGLLIAGVGSSQVIRPEAIAQIEALIQEKQTRSPTEQKIDSNLLYAVRTLSQRAAGDARPTYSFVDAFIAAEVAADQTVHVNIRAAVNEDLTAFVALLGGQEVASFPAFDTITARVPIGAVLTLAARSDVEFIAPLEKAVTNDYATRSSVRNGQISSPAIGLVTSEGVVAHGADKAHATGITGGGGLLCVISDGINSAGSAQATGDLPSPLYVLAGQAGSGDEGTAMLEIAHDMAPEAQLGFATGFNGAAQMATNILNLRSAGCAIIVDDVTYSNEPAFQDGPIAQAVASVQSSGALYFSSSANSGNVTHGTSGTWEGDWAASAYTFLGAPAQLFGTNPYNVLTKTGNVVVLQWSDPWGASSNDYDLYMLDPTGSTLVNQSTNRQTGFQNPSETFSCTAATCPVNGWLVVVKYAGTARALRLDTFRGKLSLATAGSTFGHNATPSLSVGAVDVATAFGGSFVGGAANPVESFSSDGPRKLFFNPVGTAITPGNYLFATNGGVTLAKVDLAAADGVATTLPPSGLNLFFGTSAAAPHAAGIAALVWSANSSLSATSVKNAMLATALDIEGLGVDRDSGVGIVMASAAVRAVMTPLDVSTSFTPASIAPGAASTLTITMTNPNSVPLQGVAFTDSYPAGVTNSANPTPGFSGAGCHGTLGAAPNGGSLTLTAGYMPALSSCNVFVTVVGTSSGTYNNSTGPVTTPVGLNGAAASSTLTVTTSQQSRPPPGRCLVCEQPPWHLGDTSRVRAR